MGIFTQMWDALFPLESIITVATTSYATRATSQVRAPGSPNALPICTTPTLDNTLVQTSTAPTFGSSQFPLAVGAPKPLSLTFGSDAYPLNSPTASSINSRVDISQAAITRPPVFHRPVLPLMHQEPPQPSLKHKSIPPRYSDLACAPPSKALPRPILSTSVDSLLYNGDNDSFLDLDEWPESSFSGALPYPVFKDDGTTSSPVSSMIPTDPVPARNRSSRGYNVLKRIVKQTVEDLALPSFVSPPPAYRNSSTLIPTDPVGARNRSSTGIQVLKRAVKPIVDVIARVSNSLVQSTSSALPQPVFHAPSAAPQVLSSNQYANQITDSLPSTASTPPCFDQPIATEPVAARNRSEKGYQQGIARAKLTSTKTVHHALTELYDGEVFYKVFGLIASGGFGHVVCAQRMDTREIVAIKVISKTSAYYSEDSRQDAMTEFNVFKWATTTNQPFLMHLIRSWSDDKSIYYVMNCYPETLRSWSRKCPSGKFDFFAYSYKLVRAVAALHHGKMIHRDIKPDNVLIDARGDLALTDFGFTHHYNPNHMPLQEQVGTSGYQAPETFVGALAHHGWTNKADVFSLGATLLQLYFELPDSPFAMDVLSFDDRDGLRINLDIAQWDGDSQSNRYTKQLHLKNPVLLHLILKMLKPNPVERYSIDDVLNHYYFSSVDENELLSSTPESRNSVGPGKQQKLYPLPASFGTRDSNISSFARHAIKEDFIFGDPFAF